MTAVLTLSVILFGVMSYWQLPVNDLPAVDYPVIQVQVGYPGASPDTIANNIATPLERQFMQINGLEVVTSQSTQGFATFTLQFALEKDIDAAATDVQTAISQALGSLPADLPSPPTYSKSNPNDQSIMYIALTSDSVTFGSSPSVWPLSRRITSATTRLSCSTLASAAGVSETRALRASSGF